MASAIWAEGRPQRARVRCWVRLHTLRWSRLIVTRSQIGHLSAFHEVARAPTIMYQVAACLPVCLPAYLPAGVTTRINARYGSNMETPPSTSGGWPVLFFSHG